MRGYPNANGVGPIYGPMFMWTIPVDDFDVHTIPAEALKVNGQWADGIEIVHNGPCGKIVMTTGGVDPDFETENYRRYWGWEIFDHYENYTNLRFQRPAGALNKSQIRIWPYRYK